MQTYATNIVPEKEIEEKVSHSNANIKSPLQQFNRDNLNIEHTVKSYDGQSRITKNTNQSSSNDIEVATAEVRTGNKKHMSRKTSLFVEQENSSYSTMDSKTEYDEYEEDDISVLWQLPKAEEPSQFSLLIHKWIAAQPKPVEEIVMPKKARKVLMKEQAALAAAEAEETRAQIIKDMYEQIRLETYEAEKHVLVEEQEAVMRKTQLEETLSVLHNYNTAFLEYVEVVEEEENWIRYMICDGLPDPGNLSEMNTFIFLWFEENKDVNISDIANSDVIIYLLNQLDEIIRFSWMKSSKYIIECKAIRQEFRDKLQEWIDAACYSLLRQIERDMIPDDMRSSRYISMSNKIVCCIWALIKWPIGLKQITNKDRKPVEVHFEEIESTFKLPTDIDCYCMAIRVLWQKYDHYSDSSSSYFMLKLPDEYENAYVIDFLTYCQTEYDAKLKIRNEQVDGRRLRLEEKKAILERMENPPVLIPERKGRHAKKAGIHARAKQPEPEQEQEELPYLPTPDEIILQREVECQKKIRKLLFTRCEKTEINLRKYRILGGVLHIDLVYQPPQPKDMRREIMFTTLQIPKKLKFVQFSKSYEAPLAALDSERTPEVIEAEMRALEAAMEELALITLKLPSTIAWFEPPLVAHWIPEEKIWSTDDIHDIKYNEEKQTITFRTGRLGVHGLAAFKFINIPFQSWELKPEMGRNARGGIVLNVTAAIVQAEFIIREDLVCLNSLAGGTSTALKAIIGQYMKLYFLIEKMREAGCDLFPERDVYSYVKGLPIKHLATEKHLYKCMALLCTAYSFSWSRWNASRNPRELVIQFKELHGCIAKERTNINLLITPLRTIAISCTEVSSEFSDIPVDGENSKFYADLYHLALQNAGIKSRLLMKNIPFKLVNTVIELLGRTNVVSMSS